MEKTDEIKRYLKFQKKIRALRLGEDLGSKYACEVFGISKTTYYNWKKKYEEQGEKANAGRKEIQGRMEIVSIRIRLI